MATEVTAQIDVEQILAKAVSAAIDRLPEGWEDNMDSVVQEALNELNAAVVMTVTYGSIEHMRDLATLLESQIAGKTINAHLEAIDKVASMLWTLASAKAAYFRHISNIVDSRKETSS